VKVKAAAGQSWQNFRFGKRKKDAKNETGIPWQQQKEH
jgi:hypothetical protein